MTAVFVPTGAWAADKPFVKTIPPSVASILAVLLVGCASQTKQQAITDSGAIISPHGNSGVGPSEPAVKEPAFTAETRFAAGQVNESQNNPLGAITQYSEALKLQPDHLGALYRLGVVETELKRYPQALDAWERYVKASGQSATAYGDLGFCAQLAGQDDRAEAAYQAGIARDPKCIPCRVNYGLLLARRGKITDAVTQWEAVLTDAQIYYNLGSLDAAQGRKQQARQEFRKALELDPNFTDAQQRMATLDSD